jgi:predicted TIM-barrel fold metal-dependent hydrolase
MVDTTIAGGAVPQQFEPPSRYTVVSTDSHTGPSLSALRPYCPKDLLDEFDAFGDDPENRTAAAAEIQMPPEQEEIWRRMNSHIGVNDPYERIKNMDSEGIAAEVVFHGTGPEHWGGALMPFVNGHRERHGVETPESDLRAIGRRIFNEWLADFCSVAPDRLIGVPEIPFWDVEAAVAELHWATEHGFKAANLAAPRPGLATYDDPVWEPFWSAAEDGGLALNCHSGARLHTFPTAGKAYGALFWSETHFLGHSPFAMMAFSGVFERHPNLKVIFNEQRGYWVRQALRDLDAIHLTPWNQLLREENDVLPSTYWRNNCFIGGSYLAHFELEAREEIGIDTITWGRDYPHPEGTWPHTIEALRSALFDLTVEENRKVLGENAARCYGLDLAHLDEIGSKIGPLVTDVAEPLAATPADFTSLAFRDRDDIPGGARLGAY